MKECLMKFVSIGFMIMLIGAAWAGPEHDGRRHHEMHGAHAGMMPGGHDFDRIVEHMSRRLDLNETQTQAIRNIVEAAKPEADTLRERARANREAMHALNVSDADYDVKLQNLAVENGELVTQMTLLHGRVMGQVNGELTVEQRDELSKSRDAMKKRFRQRGHFGDSPDDTTT
jgi:Spy/CpxP family protein refolding chaperone